MENLDDDSPSQKLFTTNQLKCTGMSANTMVINGPVTIAVVGKKEGTNTGHETVEESEQNFSGHLNDLVAREEECPAEKFEVTILLQPCKKVLQTINLLAEGCPNIKGFQLEHVANRGAILVYNTLYEFCEDGFKRESDLVTIDDVKWPKKIMAGETFKPKKDFEKRIIKNIKKGHLGADHYRHTTNSSIHFVKDACNFLGIGCPPAIQIVLENLGALINSMAERTVAASAEASAKSARALASPFASTKS